MLISDKRSQHFTGRRIRSTDWYCIRYASW